MKMQCPYCKVEITARDEYAGKKVKCPKCNNPFVVDGDNPLGNKTSISMDPKNNDSKPRIESEKTEKEYLKESYFDTVPHKFRQYLHKEEKILYASNPSKGALFLSIVIPAIFFIISFLMLFFIGIAGLFSVLFWGVLTFIIYLSWKNKYYIVTDKRTFAAEGIFNVAVSIIPNKSIQMICINTGIIDKLLGLNTLEISSAAQGGTNIFRAFLGKSKGTIKLSAIARVQDVIKIYHPVFA